MGILTALFSRGRSGLSFRGGIKIASGGRVPLGPFRGASPHWPPLCPCMIYFSLCQLKKNVGYFLEVGDGIEQQIHGLTTVQTCIRLIVLHSVAQGNTQITQDLSNFVRPYSALWRNSNNSARRKII